MNWQNVTVKLSDLQPWEHNPRTMTKKQAQRLLKSWQELGQFQTIAIGPSDNGSGCPVYDGHQRLSALLAAYGAQYAIDARQSDRALTEDERRYLITQANLPVGAWRFEEIAGWPEAQEWGFDAEMLQTWNSDAAALATMLEADRPQGDADAEPQIDRAAELNEKWQVQRGDLWRIGDHRLLCGDSTAREDVERVMGGERAQMMFTDPPYGVDYTGGHFHSGDVNIKRERERLSGDGDTVLYAEFLPVVLPFIDGPCYMWFAGSRALDVYSAVDSNKCEIHALIIWHKINATYAAMNAQYKQRHEPCLYFKPNGSTLRWIGPTDECTVWEVKRDPSNEFHPTQKPVELAMRAIGNHDAQICVDWFCGSGTTLVACQNLQRKCRAIEISPNYCAVILERMATAFPGIEIERISEAVLTYGT